MAAEWLIPAGDLEEFARPPEPEPEPTNGDGEALVWAFGGGTSEPGGEVLPVTVAPEEEEEPEAATDPSRAGGCWWCVVLLLFGFALVATGRGGGGLWRF